MTLFDVAHCPRFSKAGPPTISVGTRTSSDLYFPPADNAIEASSLRRGAIRVLETDWGHVAGGPDRNSEASATIDRCLDALLGS